MGLIDEAELNEFTVVQFTQLSHTEKLPPVLRRKYHTTTSVASDTQKRITPFVDVVNTGTESIVAYAHVPVKLNVGAIIDPTG